MFLDIATEMTYFFRSLKMNSVCDRKKTAADTTAVLLCACDKPGQLTWSELQNYISVQTYIFEIYSQIVSLPSGKTTCSDHTAFHDCIGAIIG